MNLFDPNEHIPDSGLKPEDASIAFIGGTYIREFHLFPGMEVVSHKHTYDHASILASGEVLLTLGSEVTRHTGPCVLNIKANRHHRIYAVTQAVWFCVHSVDQATEAYRAENADAMDGLLIVKGH